MKIKKKIKKGYVFLLGAILILPCISLLQAQAAGGIDTGRKDCILTVSADVNGSAGANADYLEDFNEMTISVPVYRVAEVDQTGQKFTPVEGFEELDFGAVNKSNTASVWESLAEQAAELLAGNPQIEPAGTAEVRRPEGGSLAVGEVRGLATGMYLVAPEACYNPDYTVQYVFAPYLTALPCSEYTLNGEGSDAWIYETTIGLKPDAQPQYGKLNIVKNLKNYNETLGKATFVFHIIGKDKAGEIKYDEVESLTFAAAGSNTLTLEKIPAGLTVTVTEIYSGASYKIEDSGQAATVVWSDAAVEAGAAQEASVSFTNSYDGGNRGGYGVTNHFESDGGGGWNWQNPTVSAEE